MARDNNTTIKQLQYIKVHIKSITTKIIMANKEHIAIVIATLLTKLKAILHSHALTKLIAKCYFNYNNV